MIESFSLSLKLNLFSNSPSKICDLLPFPKDRLNPLASKGVYRIADSCGAVYIGETDLSIKTPQRCLIFCLLTLSAEAEFQQNMAQGNNFDSTSILAKSLFYFSRKIREALNISKHPTFTFSVI